MKASLLSLFVLTLFVAHISAEPNSETLTAFAKWLQGQQVHAKFNLAMFPSSGLGGVARADVKENDTLIMIPRGSLISNEVIRTQSFLKDFSEWTGVLNVEPTIVWLIAESGNPESAQTFQLDVLPASFPTHPLSWTEEELAETAGTGLDTATRQVKAVLQQVFDHLTEKLYTPNQSLFPGWSFERFIWAYQCVNTRSWTITNENDEKESVLVPLADMLNHKPGAGVGSLSEDKKYFQIFATQDYAAGEQVFDNYGVKSNYDLLATYGFVLEDNAYDYMSLNFNLKPTNLVHSIVEPLLKSVDANYNSIRIRPNSVPVELLRVFRLSTMQFGELEFVGRALEGRAVSLKNELAAFRGAIQALTSMLKSFPTSIQQDKDLLAESDKLTVNQRNAIILRKTHKEILVNNIVVLGKMWENILLSGELFGGVAISN